jgi:hypothetical protein
MKLFHSIGSRVQEDKSWETGELDEESFRNIVDNAFSGVHLAIADSGSLASVSSAFHKFCERQYWRRLWVIQEFAVARRLDIVCGGVRIRSNELEFALDSVTRMLSYLEDLDETDEYGEHVLTGRAIVEAFTSSASSFMEGLVTRRHRYQTSQDDENTLFRVLISSLVLEIDYNHPECSDPRDRIFAVLGLAHDAAAFDSFPNYTISCDHVYTEATKIFLDQGHIDIFSYCQFPRDGSIPTWVPDWRKPVKNPNTYSPWVDVGFSTSGDSISRQKIVYTNLNSITLRGIKIDTIKEFGSSWDPHWLDPLHPNSTLTYLTEIKALIAQSPKISHRRAEKETSRIAIADFGCATDPKMPEEALACYLRLLNAFPTSTIQQNYAQDTWYRRALQLLHSRRPFISNSGFIGLAPSNVELGDVICIFLGGHVPYVLRQESDKAYNLVGEAYVHGIMYGEYMRRDPKIEAFTLR